MSTAAAWSYIREHRPDWHELQRDVEMFGGMEGLKALQHVRGAREVAKAIERLQESLKELASRLPAKAGHNLARELADWDHQLWNIRLHVTPERHWLPGGSGPPGFRGGIRVRFAEYMNGEEGRPALSATELMCLALIAGIRGDEPTDDLGEVDRRRDTWKKVIRRAKGGPERHR